MNNTIVKLLSQIADIYDMLGQTYRAKAYTTAARNIVTLPQLTIDYVNNTKIPGVGNTIKQRIIEYLTTGSITELNNLLSDPMVIAIKMLSDIPGVGRVTATGWYKMGITSINELRKRVKNGLKLTHMQTIGLQYYEDLQQRIPRDTVTEISHNITNIIRDIDQSAIVETLGSYRRQLQSSGDVDMMVTNHSNKNIIPQIRDSISKSSRYIDYLVAGDLRYTFLYRDVNGIARQVDIFYAKWVEHAAYLMYATGSGEHNEYVRGVAKSKGYRLNQTGLYKIHRGGLKRVHVESEHDIYKQLGLEYIPPNKRI